MTWFVLWHRDFSSPREMRLFGAFRMLRLLCAATVFVVALSGHAEPRATSTSNPDRMSANRPGIMETFARMMRPASAVAAPRAVAKRSQRIRQVKRKPAPADARTSAMSAAAVAMLPAIVGQPFWPNSATNLGPNEITPVVVKTVREIVQELSPSDAQPEEVVLANELSDLDIAASEVSSAAATTDGSARAEPSTPPPDASRFHAFVDAAARLPQAGWFEAMLLAIAAALAALTAIRVFAWR